jgi:hypothetical protein
MDATIEFDCTVVRVGTLADGGKRVTLDLPEDTAMQLAAMSEFQRFGAALHAVLTVTGTGGRRQHKAMPRPDPMAGDINK